MDKQAIESALEPAQSELNKVARRGGLWLAFACVAAVGWMVWAPLDEGVPAAAQVAIETQRKSVQHLSGGIVTAVNIKEGQEVQTGAVLFELDAAAAKANFESVRQRHLGLRIMQDRLFAEQAKAQRVTWGEDIVNTSADPWIRAQMDMQEALLVTRRQSLRAELDGLAEALASQRAAKTAAEAMFESRTMQQRLLAKEIADMRPVVEEGYLPKNGLRQLERQWAELDANLKDLKGRAAQAANNAAELEQRIQRTRFEFRRDLESQLASITAEIRSDVDKLSALRDELQRSQILSPATGQVVALAVQTVGAVIQPGQRLLDIVPKGAPLVLDVRVPPHVIDRVQVGLATDVRFSAFAHSPHLVVQGRVQSVSQDLLTESEGRVSYYLARVTLTKQGMTDLGPRRLQPGMPAEVVIKTGERSMFAYLLHPLLKRVAASFKEE